MVVPKKTKKVKQPKKTKKEKGSDDEDDEDYQVPLLKVHTVGEKHVTRQSAWIPKPAVAVENLERDMDTMNKTPAVAVKDTTPAKPADIHRALEADIRNNTPAVAVEDLETDTRIVHIAEVHQALEVYTTPAVAVEDLEMDTTPANPQTFSGP